MIKPTAFAALLFLAPTMTQAKPTDCALLPISVQDLRDGACSTETTFDFDAFYVNQHYKEFSVPPSVVPGRDARGILYELRGRGPAGDMIYAAVARADNATHVRFETDLEKWAATGWLSWRRGASGDWSSTDVRLVGGDKWYSAQFTWDGRACRVVQRYDTLHGNGFRYAVIAARCGDTTPDALALISALKVQLPE